MRISSINIHPHRHIWIITIIDCNSCRCEQQSQQQLESLYEYLFEYLRLRCTSLYVVCAFSMHHHRYLCVCHRRIRQSLFWVLLSAIAFNFAFSTRAVPATSNVAAGESVPIPTTWSPTVMVGVAEEPAPNFILSPL